MAKCDEQMVDSAGEIHTCDREEGGWLPGIHRDSKQVSWFVYTPLGAFVTGTKKK